MIVGISGKIGSGKDEVGKIIQFLTSNHGIEGTRVYEQCKNKVDINGFGYSDYWRYNSPYSIKKFADKLKDIVCLLLNCTREQLEDREFKEKELGGEWDFYEAGEWNERFILAANIPYDKTKYRGLIKQKMTPRLILQLLGTEAGRDIIHPNIWVNALMSEYKETKPPKGGELGAYRITSCVDCKQSFSGYKRQFICNTCHDLHDWFPDWIITDMRFPNELKAVKDREGITIRVNRVKHIVKSNNEEPWWGNNYETHITKEHSSETALDNVKFDYVVDNNGTIEELIEKVREILIKEGII